MSLFTAQRGAGRPPPLASAGGSYAAQNLPALTSIRFLLALGVVLFHLQIVMLSPDAPPIAIIERARLGVDIFFILSGFVLAHTYGEAYREGRYNHRRFLVARLARIYPNHLAMLLLMTGVAGLAIALRQPFDAERYSLSRWVMELTLTQAWLPVIPPSEWNGPAWSLSAEWAAYLAFPLFAFVGLKAGRKPWVTLLAAGLVLVIMDQLYQWRFGQIVTHADSLLGVMRIPAPFLYGIGLQQLGLRIQPGRSLSRLVVVIAALVLLTAMQWRIDERVTVALAGPLVLGLAWLSATGPLKILGHPLAVRAGEASFALYLLHLPMLVIWKNAATVLSGIDSSYRMPLWEAALFLPLCILSAFVLHAAWEVPARDWFRSRFSPRHPERIP
ncbi:acyltransferase [Caulobacter sp. RHG1]|uniref:acyltransferase family protein n=1 Tax=Caulobacter sp. (strain RHG1) TaxID=2545762 RepID=UPI0015549D7C|nr:acyltransferase [Caulobacter sp. RHG1]NQE61441.1 Acyltransferase 3 [Caulobacter sp. RHG1]